MSTRIDITPEQLDIVQGILKDHLPKGTLAWAFGSRVRWMAKPFSDLDIALEGAAPLPADVLIDLEEAFGQSDLPWKVDVIDLNAVSPEFRAIVEAQKVPADWRPSTWGIEISLDYGKALRGYQDAVGQYRVFGTNGPVGWTDKALANGPGVILGRKGAYRGVHFSESPFWVIDTAYFVRPLHDDLDMRWLYYAIQYHKLGEIDDGSPIPSTTRAAVYVREVDIPSIHEQKAIAKCLSVYENKIELNRRTNETLEAMARAVFRDWFVDFGPTRRKAAGITDPAATLGHLLPDPAQASELAALFPDSFGADGLPEGWVEKPLDEIADFLNGLALQKFPAKAGEDSLPVIKIAELRGGVSAKSNRASLYVPERYILRDGDYCFSWSGSLMAKYWTEGAGALNQHLFKVTSVTHPMWAVSGWVEHHLAEFQRIAAAKAVTMGHIKRSHLAEAMCVLPRDQDFELMGEIIGPLIDLMIRNSLENQTLANTRDLLLPKLMSGEIRLKNVEDVT